MTPGDLAQLALHGVELVAVVDADVARRNSPAGYLSGSSVTTTMRFDALGRDLPRDVGGRERAVDRLAAGHRDRVVVEDLVGDVDVGGDRGADREQPAVVVGAVAQVREDVLLFGERRLADPGHAFAAHLRELAGRRGPSRSP